jgi:alginate production protein
MKVAYGLTLTALMLSASASGQQYTREIAVESFLADNSSQSLGGSQNGAVAGLNLKPRLGLQLKNSWQAFLEAQLYVASTDADIEFDNQQGSDTSEFAGLRELWIGHSGFSDYPGDVYRVGLERKRILDGVIFDTSIVGGSWIFSSSLLQLQLGVGEQQDNLRTDEYFLPKEVEELRVAYLTGRWQYGYRHAMSGYVIRGEGDDNPLQTQITWAGFGIDNGYYIENSAPGIGYSAYLHTASGTQLSPQTFNEDDVDGMATDLGLRWRFEGDWQPIAGIQFTAADGGAEGYRPTGFESNRAKFTGTRSVLYRFNEALRADLRNLEIASAYFSVARYKQWDLNLVFSQINLHEIDSPYYLNGRPQFSLAGEKNLGRGADLVFSGYLNRKGPGLFSLGPFDSVIRLRLSMFHYSAAQKEMNVTLNNVEAQYAAMFSWIINL